MLQRLHCYSSRVAEEFEAALVVARLILRVIFSLTCVFGAFPAAICPYDPMMLSPRTGDQLEMAQTSCPLTGRGVQNMMTVCAYTVGCHIFVTGELAQFAVMSSRARIGARPRSCSRAQSVGSDDFGVDSNQCTSVARSHKAPCALLCLSGTRSVVEGGGLANHAAARSKSARLCCGPARANGSHRP